MREACFSWKPETRDAEREGIWDHYFVEREREVRFSSCCCIMQEAGMRRAQLGFLKVGSAAATTTPSFCMPAVGCRKGRQLPQVYYTDSSVQSSEYAGIRTRGGFSGRVLVGIWCSPSDPNSELAFLMVQIYFEYFAVFSVRSRA